MEAKEKVTIYTTSEFFGNVVKTEATLLNYGQRPYAQYQNAVFVNFIPKGKRKARGIIKGSHKYLVVLKGTGHPTPADMFGDPIEKNDVTIKESRYMSFDDGYKKDFDAAIADIIKNNPWLVVMDVRDSANTNVIN